jgi:alkylhydroperoxidase family enzyme
LLGDRALVQAVLEDYRTAPIPEPERELFAFIEKVNQESNRIGPDDVERARRAGWSDEALYDAVTVCALFNFYNVWIDATGVHDMPAAGYEASGKRLATEGYSPKDGSSE